MKKQILILTTTIMLTGIFSEKTFATSVEETARKFYAAFDAADANTIHSLTSTDFKFYNPFMDPLDADGLVIFGESVKQSFTGGQHQIKQVISTSNSATVMGTFMGKYTAPFNGILANNKDVSVDFITVLEWNSAGKISKMTAQNNSYSFMIQLGAVPAPNPNSNIPSIMGIYENFGKGNIDGLVNALDEKIVWDVRLNPFVKDARSYNGSKDVYNFFSSLVDSWKVLAFMPVNFYESAEKVSVIGAFEYTLLKDNKNYHVNWTMTWTFKNGKPVHYIEYFDTPQLIK